MILKVIIDIRKRSKYMFKQNHWKLRGVPLIYIVLLCKDTSWVSVALMEMSMEMSTCSLMCAQQNKGKYPG